MKPLFAALEKKSELTKVSSQFALDFCANKMMTQKCCRNVAKDHFLAVFGVASGYQNLILFHHSIVPILFPLDQVGFDFNDDS